MADPLGIKDVQHYHRSWRYNRWATGLANSQNLKDIYSVSFGYTSSKKKIAAGTTTAIMAAQATATTPQTITYASGGLITWPDVPRCLSVTVGGTGSSMLDSQIVVTGKNVEGKVITETFQFAASATATVNGSKAFQTVNTVFIPAQAGTAATVAVGTQNKLGVFHRLFPNNTTVKVYQSTTISSTPTIQGVPTVVTNEKTLELNTVSPLTAPDGTTFLYICYVFDQWNAPGVISDGAGGQIPLYYTSTSTSTSSTSTSTTTTPPTTTSTSSTSTSSTSTSISTSSTSTSSTSTSTTTAP